jgi:hypothetical protein
MPLQQQILLKSLGFIRYMYEMAVQQSRQSGHRRATSILTFHDAVEMALVLGLRHHDARPQQRQNFMQYWDELERIDIHVTQRGTMQALNDVRVNLKHRVIMPAPSEIESARVHVHDFFVDNIPIMFGLHLKDASLVPMVSYVEAKEHLEQAEVYVRRQSYKEGITEIAFAFHALIEEYERQMSSVYGRSPYIFSAVSGFSMLDPLQRMLLQAGSAYGDMRDPASDFQLQALERFASEVGSALRTIQKGLKILGLGLDYNRYVRFLYLTPTVDRRDGRWTHGPLNRPEATLQECQDCLDFVIDAALHLQEAEPE